MKILKLIAMSAVIVMVTVGASNGAPASILTAAPAATGITTLSSTAFSSSFAFVNGMLVPSYTVPIPPITFTWSATAPAGGFYDIEITTDATLQNSADIVASSDSGHNPANSCSLPGTTTTFPTTAGELQPSTTYYIAIQAYDSTCTPGSFTTGGSGWAEYFFYTSVATPTLISPANNAVLINNLTNDNSVTPPHPFPLFYWTSVAGATSYQLQVSTTTEFTSLYLNVNVPYSSTFIDGLNTYIGYTPAADLPNNTNFFWRVEALSSAYSPSGWSNPTSTWTFSTGNAAIPAPKAINVGNSKVTNDWTPLLRWNEIALPGGTTFSTYEVQVSTDPTFYDTTQLCFDVTSTQVPYLANQMYQGNPSNTTAQLDTQDALTAMATCPAVVTISGEKEFAPVTNFYWRVRAVDSLGTSDWSTILAFTTSYPRVDSTTFSPITGAHLTSNYQTFSWAPVSPMPQGYEIEFSLHSDFSTKDADAFVQGTSPSSPSFTPDNHNGSEGLVGGTLYWRVRAVGPYGPGLWSSGAQVITGNPPTNPGIPHPFNGAQVSSLTPTLTWTPVTVAPATTFGYYEVEVSIDPAFGTTVVDDMSSTSITTLSYTVAPALSPSTTYYWRVRACNSMPECSQWSTYYHAGKPDVFKTGP